MRSVLRHQRFDGREVEKYFSLNPLKYTPAKLELLFHPPWAAGDVSWMSSMFILRSIATRDQIRWVRFEERKHTDPCQGFASKLATCPCSMLYLLCV